MEPSIYCVQLIFLVNIHEFSFKYKRGISIVNAFQKVLDSSKSTEVQRTQTK